MRASLAIIVASIVASGCVHGAAQAQNAQSASGPRVTVEKGNIFIQSGSQRRQLTKLGRDEDPALSPDGAFVVFTRTDGKPPPDDSPMDCKTGPAGDQLRRINADGSGDQLLLAARAGDEPPKQLCRFEQKQFTSDGRRLFFLSPGWTTSGALHVYDFGKKAVSFVAPANTLVVLNFCKGEHRDRLVISQHRYFLGGGAYDWHWMFDRDGKKEIGAVGDDSETRESIVEKVRDIICAP